MRSVIEDHVQYKLILCADLSIEIDVPSLVSDLVQNFIHINGLKRNDLLHPTANRYIYVNEPLHVASCIDYIISSADLSSVAFIVLHLDINLSDHLPIRYDTIGEFNVDWKAEYSALSSTRSQKKKLKQPTPVPL